MIKLDFFLIEFILLVLTYLQYKLGSVFVFLPLGILICIFYTTIKFKSETEAVRNSYFLSGIYITINSGIILHLFLSNLNINLNYYFKTIIIILYLSFISGCILITCLFTYIVKRKLICKKNFKTLDFNSIM